MSERSDDNIERFFHKAAGQYEDPSTEFREEDWRKMEKMLDEEDARRAAARSKKRKIGGGIGAGMVLLLSVLLYFSLDDRSQDTDRKITTRDETVAANNNGLNKSTDGSGQVPEDIQDSDAETSNTEKSIDNIERVEGSAVSGRNENNIAENTGEPKEDAPLSTSKTADRKTPGNTIPEEGTHIIADNEVVAPKRNSKPSNRNLTAQKRDRAENTAGLSVTDTNDDKTPDTENRGFRVEANEMANARVKPGLLQKDDMSDNDGTNSSVTSMSEEDVTGKERALVRTQPENVKDNFSDGTKNETDQSRVAAIQSSGNAAGINGSSASASEGNEQQDKDTSGVTDTDNDHLSFKAGTEEEMASDQKKVVTLSDKNSQRSDEESGEGEKQKKIKEKNQKNKDKDQDRYKGDTTKLHDKNWPTSRWSIALMAAPDFSSTGLSEHTAPGSAFGAVIQYQPFGRLSISSGIIRSDKKYWGNGDEYHPPPGYWVNRTNGIIPERVYGTCMVLEIPLTIRYNLMEVKKNLLYASAGVSSYLMQKQRYEYTFAEENPGAATEWRSKGPENYLFGLGVFSVGYEHLVHSRFSIGIEPHVKVPFSGVGWPGIKLYTIGAYVTLRYRLLKKEPILSQP